MSDARSLPDHADGPDGEGARKAATGGRRAFLRLLGSGAAVAATGGIAARLGFGMRTVAAGEDIGARQWAMVIDLRRCDGCGRCQMACNLLHQLPDDQPWIKVHELTGPSGQTYFMPQPCMQCERPPCVQVCPVGATYRGADGVTLVDQDRCIGCRMCMAACPYEARTFTWDAPEAAASGDLKPTPEFPVPQQQGTAGKCVLCVHDLRVDRLPACALACRHGAIYVGDLMSDVASNGKQTVRLSSLLDESDVFRPKEELGTHPRVFYIPGHGQSIGSSGET
jgi:molybdopterin-containing oxidoreductase family iron-sulfur binding subunit